MFLELEGELVNLDRVRKVTYDEDHDCTILHYDRDYATRFPPRRPSGADPSRGWWQVRGGCMTRNGYLTRPRPRLHGP